LPDRIENPGGWLRRVVQNAAVDRLRRRAREESRVSLEEYEGLVSSEAADEIVARRLDQQANTQLVKDALALAVADQAPGVVRVVTWILNYLEDYGEMPSQRTVGKAVGVSHTAVQKSLSRYRTYLAQAAGKGVS